MYVLNVLISNSKGVYFLLTNRYNIHLIIFFKGRYAEKVLVSLLIFDSHVKCVYSYLHVHLKDVIKEKK